MGSAIFNGQFLLIKYAWRAPFAYKICTESTFCSIGDCCFGGLWRSAISSLHHDVGGHPASHFTLIVISRSDHSFDLKILWWLHYHHWLWQKSAAVVLLIVHNSIDSAIVDWQSIMHQLIILRQGRTSAFQNSKSNKNETKKIDQVNFEAIEWNFMLYRMMVLPLKSVNAKLVILISMLPP